MFKAAIVDYEICNLFSVKRALEFCGFDSAITQDPKAVLSADVVILPGVGAFGEAMQSLARLDLISSLMDVAASGKPMIGICLGFQMLFSVSYEFGETEGLNLIPGVVKQLENKENDRSFKIPHIGWDRVFPPARYPEPRKICGAKDLVSEILRPSGPQNDSELWQGTLMDGIRNGEYFYFVHSFYAIPEESRVVLSETPYGPYRFCSAVQWKNISGFQFHPERSGLAGIAIYQNIKKLVQSQRPSHV